LINNIKKYGIHIGDKNGKLFDKITRAPSQVLCKIQRNLWLPVAEVMEGIYEPFPEFHPVRNKLVVDIGARWGDYSIICNKTYGANVIAFEPLLDNYYEAIKYIQRNRANVEIFHVGLTDNTGIGFKEITTDNNMLYLHNDGVHKEEVYFTTLDSYKVSPDLLKIDVEGYEMHVLQGAVDTIRQHHPRIIIETHSKQLEYEVTSYLTTLGYSLKHEYKRGTPIKFERDQTYWSDSVVNLFFEQVPQ